MEGLQSNTLAQIASNALNDLRFYLTVIEPVKYQAPLDLLSGSTIGQHSRHIIEFYQCLLEQSEVAIDPVISYAKRRRDFMIESHPDHAIRCVDEICERLNSIDVSKSCVLDTEEHAEEGLLVRSTVGRELLYNVEHTIHHLAIVKIALKEILPDLSLPEHFGVAPSTLRHRHEACAQ